MKLGCEGRILTLMCDLKDWPERFVLLFAFVAGVLGILHLVLELEQSIFDILEAIWRWLAVLSCTYGRHRGDMCALEVSACTGRLG